VFRFSFHNLASVPLLGVSVVDLSHLSTTRAIDRLSDLLVNQGHPPRVGLGDGPSDLARTADDDDTTVTK